MYHWLAQYIRMSFQVRLTALSPYYFSYPTFRIISSAHKSCVHSPISGRPLCTSRSRINPFLSHQILDKLLYHKSAKFVSIVKGNGAGRSSVEIVKGNEGMQDFFGRRAIPYFIVATTTQDTKVFCLSTTNRKFYSDLRHVRRYPTHRSTIYRRYHPIA